MVKEYSKIDKLKRKLIKIKKVTNKFKHKKILVLQKIKAIKKQIAKNKINYMKKIIKK